MSRKKKPKSGSVRDVDHVPPSRPRKARRAVLVIAGVVGVGLVAMVASRFGGQSISGPHAPQGGRGSFVGSSTCVSCHADQGAQWSQSQHKAAIALANEKTVLGDFERARFAHAGATSEFFRRDGKYFTRTDGPDGKSADFEVKYTFGVQPLQQYLIELPGGRLQALSIAWDSRPKGENGQRWFHLYSKEATTHRDELHWTQPSQNWNFMCADCHSTGVQKNYDRANDRFQTHWSEISVGCEACHGPGSSHVTWASARRAGDRVALRDSTKGLNARLDERHDIAWKVNATSGNATRSHPRVSEREIETCAQCHSRRSQIADGYEAGKPFLDYYRPALLTRPYYHADGQQREEVYDWGSFLQSKMYAKGVTCSDCHNPHSGKLRAEGNAVCASCHLPSKYDAPAHLRHKAASPGATCVGCHMPTTNYMVIDARHDHSLRIPRPDLSVALGTPNACTSCHTQRDARWAAAQVDAWYGSTRRTDPHERLARTFTAVDSGRVDGQSLLRALASDATQPPIARATALAELSAPEDGPTFDALNAALHDSNALIRFGALQSVEHLPLESRLRLAVPLLSDPMKAIRIDAVRFLAGAPVQQMSRDQQVAFERASVEFVETQRYNADRVEARIALGTFLGERGEAAAAEMELQSAIQLAPSSVAAYVNLADVYRAQGRDAEGERVLRAGLETQPGSGTLHYALGLALTRLNRGDTALHEFARAASLEPGNARFAYVHAIALHSSGKADAAMAQLKGALSAHPADRDILTALARFYAERGDAVEAKRYAEQLRTLAIDR